MEETVVNNISKIIYEWSSNKGYPFTYDQINITFIVITLPIIWKIIKSLYNLYNLYKTAYDLSPFIERSEIENATKYFVSTKGQNISPANELEPRNAQAFTAKISIIPFYLKLIGKRANDAKHFLILADSGMGKSTFLINLYFSYTRLFFLRKYKMVLVPLANPNVDEYIEKLDRQEKTILLLDGFDEDPKALIDYQTRIEEIVKKTWRFKYIFLTSRTQFFPSETKEPFSTKQYRYSLDGPTNHYFKKVYLSPFDDSDVRLYLNKKYPLWKIWKLRKRSKARHIISVAPNLMVRPMLLSYIDSLLEGNTASNVTHTSRPKGKLTISYVYGILINRWIEREANRIDPDLRTHFKENMYKFSKALAVYMYSKKRIKVEASEIVEIAHKNGIELTELELKGKSLLNRDSAGYYKFAHKSILEFLLAQHAIHDPKFGDGVMYFKGILEYEQASIFYTELMVSEITN